MTTLYVPSFFQPVDNAGVPLAGAKLYFYESGTTTEITVYQDFAQTTPHTNPVVADADGVFPPIYVEDATYKTVLKTALDVTVETTDPVGAGTIIPNVETIDVTSSITVTDTQRGAKLNVETAGVTVTFGAASGYDARHSNLIANRTSRVVYVAANGHATFKLWPGQSAALYNVDGAWIVRREARYRTPSSLKLYVDHAEGSDVSNDGMAAGSGNAFATIQHAIEVIEEEIDCGGFGPSIQLTTTGATFTENNVVGTKRIVGYHVIYIVGDTSNPTAAIWNVEAGQIGLQARDWSGFIIDGFTMQSDGDNATGIRTSQFGVIDIWNVDWGTFAGTSGYHIHANGYGSIGYVPGAVSTIKGNVTAHWRNTGGNMVCVGAEIAVFSAAQVFGTAFLESTFGGQTNMSGMTFSGSGAGTASSGNTAYMRSGAKLVTGGATLPGDDGYDVDGAYVDNVMLSLTTSGAVDVGTTLEVGTSATVGTATGVTSTGTPLFEAFGAAGSEYLVRNTTDSREGVLRAAASSIDVGSTTATALRLLVAGTARAEVDTSGNFHPTTNNASALGKEGFRWTALYAVSGTINTSDARVKTPVEALGEAEIEASKALAKEIGSFRFLDAVAQKGEGARLHIGMTVQRAIEIMEAFGLDPFRYAFICYDEWEADETREAGSEYGFRTDQLLAFIARRFQARLAALEAHF